MFSGFVGRSGLGVCFYVGVWLVCWFNRGCSVRIKVSVEERFNGVALLSLQFDAGFDGAVWAVWVLKVWPSGDKRRI